MLPLLSRAGRGLNCRRGRREKRSRTKSPRVRAVIWGKREGSGALGAELTQVAIEVLVLSDSPRRAGQPAEKPVDVPVRAPLSECVQLLQETLHAIPRALEVRLVLHDEVRGGRSIFSKWGLADKALPEHPTDGLS